MRRTAIALLSAAGGCAPAVRRDAEAGRSRFVDVDPCVAFGWPAAAVCALAILAAAFVACYWIYAHYEPGP